MNKISAFESCPATIEGRWAIGQMVRAYDGTCYRVASRGIRYHEGAAPMYGVKPAREPRTAAATQALRAAIAEIARGDQSGLPSGLVLLLRWQDAQPGSMASFPWLEIYAEGYVRAVRPRYEDSPVEGWLHDPKAAARLTQAIAVAPAPHHLPVTNVRQRAVRRA